MSSESSTLTSLATACLGGPNIEQTLAVVGAANVSVTASGGVSSLDDIKRLRERASRDLDSVIVGKALYEGKFKLEEAIIGPQIFRLITGHDKH